MPWVILRFALVGPFVGCLVYIIASRLGPALSGPNAVPLRVMDVITALIEGVAAAAYGVVFTLPVSGSLAAVAGLIYWQLLKRHRLGNWHRAGRILVGGLVGLLCALAFGTLFFDSRDIRASLLALIPWALAGIAGGACGALTIGKRLYEVVLPSAT